MNSGVIAALLSAIFTAQGPAVMQSRRVAAAVQARNGASQNAAGHIITVSRSGEAYAKPDLGILIMSIRSTSPIADEAVNDNARKAKDAEEALAGLGFSPTEYQISSVTFGQEGGPQFPGQGGIATYQANQYIYVFFEGADLSDAARLTDKSAGVIEVLRKAGAGPANAANRFGPVMVGAPQGALIIYTVKYAGQYERKALQVAITRARVAAHDIAMASGVQLGALQDVRSGYLAGSGVIPRAGSSPLVGLKYRFFTTKIDELTIIANVTLQYDFTEK
jgi:uncharacterized protein YggE